MASRTFILSIALVALTSCAAAFAHTPATANTATMTKDTDRAATPKPLPFEPDEQLTYEGEFSKLLLRGINIAEFKFTVERAKTTAAVASPPAAASSSTATSPSAAVNSSANTPPANLIFKGDVLARGWFRKLFGIDFHYNTESVVEPTSLLILSNSVRDEQGKRLRTSEAVFDRTHNLLTWTLRNPNDPQAAPRVVTAPLQNASHDLISAIYFLRTQTLEPGRQLELNISDSGAVYRIPVKVGARKRMKTVVGRVQTVRVDIEIFGAERLVDRKGEMTLWITDDARRLPVRARIEIDMGTLDINLKKVSGGHTPSTRP
ncbi:MAG: hypothetical protein QOG71_3006 [Pyrinomonadaceae bacterium]|nr:hypothetical protein [Pyrinomonadaceae bacterium]